MYQEGDVIEDAAALNWLLDTHMKRKQPTGSKNIIQRDSCLSDESVLEKAITAKNADKFNKLWNGDISSYPSQSEADVVLCSILAFYCNSNFEQVDRLFQKSALMRDKWTSPRGDETYGAITIKQAVANTSVFYSPIPKVTAFEDFAEGLELLEQLNPIDNSKYSWTEIGAGRIFADFNEATLRYVPERKMWFYYENGYWQSDTGNLKAQKACMQLADLLHLFALRITDEHKRKAFITYSNKWQAHSYRNNILKDAQVHKPISMKSFDSNPYIFNCKNGTLHLDTGKFTPHSSEDKLTKISSVEYDPAATCERWNDFISEIMSDDMEKAKFLQKIFGYALSGDNRHDDFAWCY